MINTITHFYNQQYTEKNNEKLILQYNYQITNNIINEVLMKSPLKKLKNKSL